VADVFSREHQLAYALLHPDLTFKQASHSLRRFIPDPEADVLDQPLAQVFVEFIGAEEALRAILRGELPELRLERVNRDGLDGAAAYLFFKVVPYDPERTEAGLVLIVEDMTAIGHLEQRVTQDRNELRLIEIALTNANLELLRLNEFKSLFLELATYDLRPPLTLIRMACDVLRRNASARLTETDLTFLQRIEAQEEALEALLASLLDMDLYDRSELPFEWSVCDVPALASDVITRLQPLANHAQVSVRMVLPAGPLRLRADGRRLKQVLRNALEHAVKHSIVGDGVTLRVTRDETHVFFVIQGAGTSFPIEALAAGKLPRKSLRLLFVQTFVAALRGQLTANYAGREALLTLAFPLGGPSEG
jgi:signal transduction histidine kinase